MPAAFRSAINSALRIGHTRPLVAALVVGITVFGPLFALETPAFAYNTAEIDCLNMIGGGYTGSNYSYAAACENPQGSYAELVGGYNTGSTFQGHLEFLYAGVHQLNLPSSGEQSYGHNSFYFGFTTNNCGSYDTRLWRYNGGSNYTDMGDAVYTVICTAPSGSSVQSPSNVHQVS